MTNRLPHKSEFIEVYMTAPYFIDGRWKAFINDYPPTTSTEKYFMFRIPVPEEYLATDLGVAEPVDHENIPRETTDL